MSDVKKYQVVVFNKTNKDGYRRAGFSLLKGANLLMDVDDTQIEQLKADPRLVFGSQDPMPTETIEEAEQRLLSENPKGDALPQGMEGGVSLADLTVAQLDALSIEYKASATKAELIALLEQAQGGE
ncbi:hypothetical protein A6046_03355 [[Haemophilus] ducreyi]|uniref:Mu-like prophage FluMu N-terminal domain-containing protein n=2 Tax=Haemophilus ducreyi TaxID=730 RepID=Q7VPF2_HAEDU|nr:HI1506-related protein [[Haemophilus] ducreyi]AAP95129.1 hypothetical protein HD_0133 [[Haemophilus] ducreyi 35000HP]AKO30302.1 hypothetical protein RY60_00505 [[Haemophilus] ducreyi]AKO31735.1 hypothetical protein RZ57_00510 [[Haemophilus] ducreyi]AKO33188.1 hypothetical protein RZ58_00510 [[Haemophilus] ducreyi]AKO34637.1 hypothetical protein RZ59_00505 [[Haemophilus] ducreyi]